mmetsp:Transcript_74151/g.154661  ORF Transcript_74151/g.154661 Transcript_74151/m.154661 type:complete len:403 (-) Transcript_74151:438-1646(-)|eukprot:CAMPEP_0206462448 /NCGR_PEP_ID=MMETSP0324_2-20121206/25988_1 /ASSEMBLY_ACC=CAM_ASM_000836 /TAXON_ID=2866 /ORGANISM="Crypthecodinium cohnii, Strain Seligo" /LENGTH=402 /DNA_ID=CAMNT_0053934613 /DNA_START=241 /DNA_END=1449 /DNA_ORIENTATION=-
MPLSEEKLAHLRALAAATSSNISAKVKTFVPSSKQASAPADGEDQPSKRLQPLPPPPPPPVLKRRRVQPEDTPNVQVPSGRAHAASTTPELTKLGFGVEEDDENDFGEEIVKVPDELVGYFIGAKGQNVRKLMMETRCTITVGKLAHEGVRKVLLTGDSATRARAKDYIEKFISLALAGGKAGGKLSVATDSIELPENFVKDVIGPRGATIQSVRSSTGVVASLEGSGSGQHRILNLKGSEDTIKQARDKVEEILLQLHRKQGVFNMELETKFAKKVRDTFQVLQPKLNTDVHFHRMASATAAATTATPAGAGAVPPASTAAYGAPLRPLSMVGSNSPASSVGAGVQGGVMSYLPYSPEELFAWARYYAADVACQEHFERLQSGGVAVGQLLFGSLDHLHLL